MGYGSKGGAEAAVHAARRFLAFPHQEDTVFLKIDFRNAFNSLFRDKMLQAVRDLMPELFPFLSQCYNQVSHLMFNEHHIPSQRGIQQGDPLGPAMFCSTIHPLASSMTAELNIWFLDDGALGGRSHLVYEDLKRLSNEAKDLGLDLNLKKCEAFNLRMSGLELSESSFPELVNNISFPELSDCVLLGAPLTEEAVPKVFTAKTKEFNLMGSRLKKISSHIGFYILKNALAIPKLSYLLRSAPIWRWKPGLREFDDVLKQTLESICNTSLTEDAWIQSALPIASGGLGIRHTENLALPAFLASVSSTYHLTNKILPPHFLHRGDSDLSDGIIEWSALSNMPPTKVENKNSQKCWERVLTDQAATNLCERAPTLKDKARLLSVASKESGAFLNVLPCSALGTLLDNNAFRIAVALRLGSQICQSYQCICGYTSDTFGIHGLNCKKTPGRQSRHAMVNDVIRRGLVSAGYPVAMEPSHLSSTDNKRPDGTTLIPWTDGKYLTWDFTCVNPLAASYLGSSAGIPRYAASSAETRKKAKYSFLGGAHLFRPIAAECLGSFSQESLSVIKAIGRRIAAASGEKRSLEYFVQRLSVAIQKGNASSIMATAPSDSSLDSFLSIL